jgi:flagellar motility protein MotE (MotC chaperone)
MNKKHIIIAAAAGAFVFSLTFGFSWHSAKQKVAAMELKMKAEAEKKAQEEAELPFDVVKSKTSEANPENILLEKKFDSLVYDVREKIQEYEIKLKDLQTREQRLQVAQSSLKEDITKMEQLRMELAETVGKIKQEQEKLNASRLKIKQTERENLKTIAATYDKMDSASASVILTNMTKSDKKDSLNLDEAVKILYYMGERSKAKVLAEMGNAEPKLAAVLCHRLKEVTTED